MSSIPQAPVCAPPSDDDDGAHLVAQLAAYFTDQLTVQLDAQLAALVDPPAACPGCVALAGEEFPSGTTSRYCARCVAHTRRVYQCQRWNADPAHQAAAGHASFSAFSARWRAESGLAPLTVEATRRYVTPEHIRGPLGILLPERLRQAIYRAWCAGQLVGVEAWLSDDPPPAPDGLWAGQS